MCDGHGYSWPNRCHNGIIYGSDSFFALNYTTSLFESRFLLSGFQGFGSGQSEILSVDRTNRFAIQTGYPYPTADEYYIGKVCGSWIKKDWKIDASSYASLYLVSSVAVADTGDALVFGRDNPGSSLKGTVIRIDNQNNVIYTATSSAQGLTAAHYNCKHDTTFFATFAVNFPNSSIIHRVSPSGTILWSSVVSNQISTSEHVRNIWHHPPYVFASDTFKLYVLNETTGAIITVLTKSNNIAQNQANRGEGVSGSILIVPAYAAPYPSRTLQMTGYNIGTWTVAWTINQSTPSLVTDGVYAYADWATQIGPMTHRILPDGSVDKSVHALMPRTSALVRMPQS